MSPSLFNFFMFTQILSLLKLGVLVDMSEAQEEEEEDEDDDENEDKGEDHGASSSASPHHQPSSKKQKTKKPRGFERLVVAFSWPFFAEYVFKGMLVEHVTAVERLMRRFEDKVKKLIAWFCLVTNLIGR